jgi:hypothetical protein
MNQRMMRYLRFAVLGKTEHPRKAPRRRAAHRGPVRNAKYLRFIKSEPSVVSGRAGCDPCHTGPHALNQKASDLTCIPLTREEHDEFDKNPRAFAEKHGLDIPALIADFNAQFFGGGR